ncbi:hypothetical protein NX059_006892 [Plenodomus lindquistii]|nr:hypothetical protein NX059_006892 [Plenodomus lindquistii]
MAGRGGRNYRGARGRGGGSSDARGNNDRNICYEFQRSGHCSRGSSCRYAHSASGRTENRGAARAQETAEQKSARQSFNAWKRLLNEAPEESRTMRRIWEGALQILEEGDQDWTQQLARDLDEDERGRIHIKTLLTTKLGHGLFDHSLYCARHFLLTLTHPALLRCLAVDTHIGSLYNFFGGVDGRTAITFLGQACKVLVAISSDGADSESTKDAEKMLGAMSLALFELLKRERRVRFNDAVSTLADSIQAATDSFERSMEFTCATRIAKRLTDVRAMVARAQNLLVDDLPDYSADAFDDGPKSFYPRNVVVPSDRHDNDKKDITEIVIFPTRNEIMSDAKEFLPFTDPDQGHFLEDPVQRHIDTYFRLARHDTFGELKGALAGVMHTVAQDANALNNPRLNFGDMRTYQYSTASVSYVSINKRKGLQAQIMFLQPPLVRGRSAGERARWWEESRRLEEGSLLSLIWVQGSSVQHIFLSVSEKIVNPGTEYGLTHNSHMASITVNLVTQDLPTFRMLMKSNAGQLRGILLEFPKVMPATFVPILECMQSMQRLSRLPFKEWIIPEKLEDLKKPRTVSNIPPPLYARTAGFRFPLETLTKTKDKSFTLDPTISCDDEAFLNELEAKTDLDRGQCRALIAALLREFAFIQGPPGTGKSFVGIQLMRVLLDIAAKADLGPILIVCYTNHALDQFLEHLVDIGVEKVIRMGGQSKSLKLRDHNLRSIGRSEDKTSSEKYMTAKTYGALEQSEKDSKSIFSALRALQKSANWANLKFHIQEQYPKIYAQFNETDKEGFQVVGRHPFDHWRSQASSIARNSAASTPIIVEKATADVHSLDARERASLLAHWVTEAQHDKIGELFEIVSDVTKTRGKLGKIHDESDRRILQEADVIGVTTSGLARRISLLQNVKCKVVVCEEAGEIMEPHLLSALLPDVEHCIQIGDHEQLRPSVNNFQDLSCESERGKLHALDRSQFERLSIGQPGRPVMPVAQLNVQRRMRPQISTLIRETIYDKLVDHGSTSSLPDVVGMRKNVFWLDHQNLENGTDMEIQHTKSKSNAWEVEMVHALVRHVVRQGVYSSEDIAVLTPYTGQLQKLRSAMRSSFEIVLSERDQDALEKDGFEVKESPDTKRAAPGPQDHRQKPLEKKNFTELLRVATVDNFQGEEAKVIIVSLVRSNEKRNVGFLKTSNRINVLLSRAKHGMYLIGNAETYSSVDMWQKVINMLRANDALGNSLALCCPRHPTTAIDVQQPDDFLKLSPEGGCREACIDRLECGHRCEARCHSEAMHAVFQCEAPCQRRHAHCDHPCKKATCGESCGVCMIKLDNVKLPCGHIKNRVDCYRTLDLSTIFCDVKVSKQVPGCGHTPVVSCSEDVTEKNFDFKCPIPCKTTLPCTHDCPGTCGTCEVTIVFDEPIVNHQPCAIICGRKMGTCNHNCKDYCHKGSDCGLCQQPCEVRCKHNRCPQKCHEPCAPCVEPCVWSCEHQGDCKMPCSAPCDRLPCDERCTKLLPCGHQCPSLCGENCPADCCQQCGMKSDEQPDMIMMLRYKDIDLDESPIIRLGCGHIFTKDSNDGLVGLQDVYTQDPMTGTFSSLKETAELAPSVPQCPNCRSPIRQYVTQRYNRAINRAVIDEMSKRFIVSGQQEMQQIETELNEVEKSLNKSRKTLIKVPKAASGKENAFGRVLTSVNEALKSRYRELIGLSNDVKSLQRRVTIQNEPGQKLHQAIIHMKSEQSALDAAMKNLSIEAPAAAIKGTSDMRITHGAALLQIKVEGLLLEDKFEIASKMRTKYPNDQAALSFWGGSPKKRTEQYLEDCKNLTADCVAGNLPKVAVESTLHYARIAQLFGSSGLADDTDRAKAQVYRNTAQDLLKQAEKLCESKFRDSDALRKAVTHATTMLSKEFYETVSKDEMDMIKKAMVSGRGGIATHSGHWYKCVNGHPFAVGECGMPMQLARCPECGEAVGGQNHTPTAGVTRAENMEN